jgi:hypothetical protein
VHSEFPDGSENNRGDIQTRCNEVHPALNILKDPSNPTIPKLTGEWELSYIYLELFYQPVFEFLSILIDILDDMADLSLNRKFTRNRLGLSLSQKPSQTVLANLKRIAPLIASESELAALESISHALFPECNRA